MDVYTCSLLQIGHKYVERRLLVAEACGGLAPYLPVNNKLKSCFLDGYLWYLLFNSVKIDAVISFIICHYCYLFYVSRIIFAVL